MRGRISSLFELSLGFEMEASGRQNILYRGYLQGETPRSMRDKLWTMPISSSAMRIRRLCSLLDAVSICRGAPLTTNGARRDYVRSYC